LKYIQSLSRLAAIIFVPLSSFAATTLTAQSSATNAGLTDQMILQIDPALGSTKTSWSIQPNNIGSLSNTGLYTAPASLNTYHDLTITATVTPSTAGIATVSVSTTVRVWPAVTISVSPKTASVGQSGTAKFSSLITNTSNTAVTWSISPSVGTVSTAGLYTVPSAISSNQTVTVKATSVADPTKSATASVALVAPAQPPPPPTSLVMPIEVMGTGATVQSVQATVPTGVDASTSSLWLQIHGLEYQKQASVKVNGSAWIPLNSANVQIQGLAAKYGGIGGGFSTLSLVVALPGGIVQNGSNTVSFQFNGTDGNSSGFRVLAFNFQENGANLIPSSAFSQDDPATWTAPSTLASDISAGQSLYQAGALTQPVPGGSPVALKAHCGDCHTKDGRDLKYFNYSNNSIYVRSRFHGMSDTQANQLVSYIRSLKTPAPATARPWNPPYQPCPGIDSQPVSAWAAGAGLSAVLSSDAAMLPYVAPTQSAADFDPNGNLSIRNTPIAYQMLDWNHWLPTIHPIDGYGSTFTSSQAFKDYSTLSAGLVPNSASAYQAQAGTLANWSTDTGSFRSSVEPAQSDSSWSNAKTAQKIYGIQQWQTVKLWELNQTFGLEAIPQAIFGATADSRSWATNIPFQTSPSISRIPPGSPGIHNGSETTFNNVSFLWYHLQLVLNSANKQQACTAPVDYGYFYGFISAQGRTSSPQAMFYLAVLQKGLQESNNGYGPQYGCGDGWDWGVNDPSFLVQVPNLSSSENIWSGLSATTRAALINSYMTQWIATVTKFTPAQFYAGGWTTSSETTSESWYGGEWAGRMAFSIPRLKYLGMTQTLATQVANWAATVWPGKNWSAFANATCTNSGGNISCSSDSLM
jgi:hypothetical protein